MANNNNNNHGQNPFWDFVQSFDPNGSNRAGAGVDHAPSGPAFGAGFPFGGPGSFNPWAGGHGWGGPWGGPPGDHPWGGRGGGRHGRHGRHGPRHHRQDTPESDREGEAEDTDEHDYDMGDDTPDTLREDGPAGPSDSQPPQPPHHPAGSPHPPPPPHAFGEGHRHHGRHGRHGGRHGGSGGPGGPGGPGGFGPRGGSRGGCRGRGGPHAHGRRGSRGPRGPPPPFGGPFDVRSIWQALADLPAVRPFTNNFEPRTGHDREAERSEEQDVAFVPPVDIFSTEKSYVLHVSLPGAVKEDVGVNWDADKSQLNIAGVVYRPGNEDFLQFLTSSERKVGMFERSIKLPPADSTEKEEVDGFGITAKMENGILIVTVPKAEREWTEIHKIDIQ